MLRCRLGGTAGVLCSVLPFAAPLVPSLRRLHSVPTRQAHAPASVVCSTVTSTVRRDTRSPLVEASKNDCGRAMMVCGPATGGGRWRERAGVPECNNAGDSCSLLGLPSHHAACPLLPCPACSVHMQAPHLHQPALEAVCKALSQQGGEVGHQRVAGGGQHQAASQLGQGGAEGGRAGRCTAQSRKGVDNRGCGRAVGGGQSALQCQVLGSHNP